VVKANHASLARQGARRGARLLWEATRQRLGMRAYTEATEPLDTPVCPGVWEAGVREAPPYPD
jgi:hypothetical protein